MIVTDQPLSNNFGSSEPFSLGVEEELLVVGDQNELVDRGEQIVSSADPDAGGIEKELFKAMVETNSTVCADAGEAFASLQSLRAELLATEASLMGTGLHPTATSGDSGVHRTGRYAAIDDLLQGVLRTPICGQHVHVGMPDAETAIRTYNGIRTHVPLINALAANSPFWGGEDSGLASARTVIFRSYPRATMGPKFADFSEFQRVTGQICAAGDLEDYRHIWWDVRLHPALGTVEVRAADTQFDLRRSAALAAFIHGLARVESERDQSRIPVREALAEATFQATRHGLDAFLFTRDGERIPARELAARTLELAASAGGPTDELEYVETMIEEGCGADLQRRVHAESGMDALLEFLVSETASSAGRHS